MAPMRLNKHRDVDGTHADRVADANVRELTVFAEAVDGRGGHSEQLRDLADGEKRRCGLRQPRCFELQTLDPIWTQPREKRCQIVPKVGSVWLRDLQWLRGIAKGGVGLPTTWRRFTRQGSQVRILQRPPRENSADSQGFAGQR